MRDCALFPCQSLFWFASPSYRLTYLDSEGDEVELESESDLADAVAQAQAAKNKVLSLFVRPVSGARWKSMHRARSPC